MTSLSLGYMTTLTRWDYRPIREDAIAFATARLTKGATTAEERALRAADAPTSQGLTR